MANTDPIDRHSTTEYAFKNSLSKYLKWNNVTYKGYGKLQFGNFLEIPITNPGYGFNYKI